MPKLNANLTMLFNEFDFLDRFEQAAQVGFKGVEFLFPYAFPAEQLAEKLKMNQLEQVLFNFPAGDWDAGERGIASHPDRTGEFQAGVGEAIEYAKALGCRQINCLAGLAPEGVSREKAEQALVENLRFAAQKLEAEGIKLLLEPINTLDMPGFFISGTGQAFALFQAVGVENLWLQYDIYHMQIMEGDLIRTITENLPRIAHMQLADNPGRHEPGTGEIHFPNLLKAIDEAGYNGWVGCEYRPQNNTLNGLSWAKAYL